MELRHLRYFVAVAEVLSFRAAASSLNLSGPALSKQIKDLETELGVRLLDRDTTQVRLTNAGSVFLGEALKILAQASHAISLAQEAAAGRRGGLTIGNVGTILANYLAASISSFCAKFPDVDVDLMDVDLFDQVTALEAGTIQVGFALNAEREKAPTHFRQISVLHSPLGVVLDGSHHLAKLRRISLADLTRERLLGVRGKKDSFHANLIRDLFTSRGLKAREVSLVNGFESLMAMVAAGQGISILALRGSIGRTENITIRPIVETGEDLGIELFALWRDSSVASPASNFVETLRQLTGSAKTHGK